MDQQKGNQQRDNRTDTEYDQSKQPFFPQQILHNHFSPFLPQ